MTLAIIIGVAFGCWLTERLWPANDLPRVPAWYPRVAVVNLVQLGIVGRRADGRPPLHFLPTCIGCSKRWACQEAREGDA